MKRIAPVSSQSDLRHEQALELRERLLYHQIHPLKLGVDISGSVASTVLF